MMNQSSPGKEFIEHYGRRGMKWGVRKASPSTASAPAHTPKPVHKMLSDEELGKVIKRLEMEKRFVDLTKEPPVQKKVGFGQKVTTRILKVAGDAAAEAGKQVLKQQIKSVLESQLPATGKSGGKSGKGKSGKGKGKKGKTKVWKP